VPVEKGDGKIVLVNDERRACSSRPNQGAYEAAAALTRCLYDAVERLPLVRGTLTVPACSVACGDVL